MNYILLFVSGMLVFNGFPHFMHGVSGEPFFLPRRSNRKKRGSPLMNVLWGMANFILAILIWKFVFGWASGFFIKVLVIIAGGLLVSLTISKVFTDRAKK